MPDAALLVNNLSVTYPSQSQPAIEDIFFALAPGTITMLIGPNGSGKTTVIKAILELVSYQGDIKVMNKPLHKSYQEIGYVPQRFSFDETFPITVEEFLRLSVFHYIPQKDALEKSIDQTLHEVGAFDLKSRKLSSLSGGQLQRVILARAIAHRPKLLLLDEPESGIDVGGEQTFYDLIQRLVKDEGMAVLVASHELDIVYTYADQVICINRRMFCSGIPREVLNHEMFVDLYGRELKFYGHEHR
jgi:ABC-type Mn2+/Zn2+ transport system ATPase subunit